MSRDAGEYFTARNFRWFLALHLILAVLSEVANYAFVPEELTAWTDYYTPDSVWLWVFVVPIALAALASYVGLWRFRRWGRTLTLVTTLLAMPLGAFLGPYVEAGLGTVLGTAAEVMGGALLVMIYLPPLSGHFR